MKHRVTFCLFALVLVTTAAASVAGPILKPRKYHGPIPRSALTLGVGFFGGASNSEMYDYFDRRVPQAAKSETESNDFDNAPLIELTYSYKAHPQFAVRVNAYAALLTSSWTGIIIPNIPPPDTVTNWVRPAVEADVEFDVTLFAAELAAQYFFTDAAVKEFQPYIGGGFTFGLPYSQYTEKATVVEADADLDDPDYEPIFTPGQQLRTVEKEQLTFEAGVHGLLGMLYYVGNRWALSAEGRIQILQTKFPLTVANEDGEPEEVKFDVDLSGFVLAVGVSYAF